MKASIEERIAELDDSSTTREDLVKYLEAIRNNLKICAEQIERRLALLLIAAFTLELSAQPGSSEASLLGVRLHDLALVRKLLPPVIAYFYYSFFNATSYRLIARQAHKRITEKLSRALFAAGLEPLAIPPGLFNLELMLIADAPGSVRSLLIAAAYLTGLGPLVYIGYSVLRSFWQFGLTDVVVWLSALITAFFLALFFVIVRRSNRLAFRSSRND